jgi:hypothetical protein
MVPAEPPGGLLDRVLTVRRLGRVGKRLLPGLPVLVYLADGTYLGRVHVPPPIRPGDLLALEDGIPLRVARVEASPASPGVAARVEAFWERRGLFRRGERQIRERRSDG